MLDAVWKELREVLWLLSMLGMLSALSVGIALAIALAGSR
jgi:hypothetical protein